MRLPSAFLFLTSECAAAHQKKSVLYKASFLLQSFLLCNPLKYAADSYLFLNQRQEIMQL